MNSLILVLGLQMFPEKYFSAYNFGTKLALSRHRRAAERSHESRIASLDSNRIDELDHLIAWQVDK